MAETDSRFDPIIRDAMLDAKDYFERNDFIFNEDHMREFIVTRYPYESFADMNQQVSNTLYWRKDDNHIAYGFSKSDSPKLLNAAFALVRTFRMMYDLYIADEAKQNLENSCRRNADKLGINQEEIPDAVAQMCKHIDDRLDEQYAHEYGWEHLAPPLRNLLDQAHHNARLDMEGMYHDLQKSMGYVMHTIHNKIRTVEPTEDENDIDTDQLLSSAWKYANHSHYSGPAHAAMEEATKEYARALNEAGNKFNMDEYKDWFGSNVNKASITAVFDINCANTQFPKDFIEHYKSGQLTDEDKQWAVSVYNSYVDEFLPAQLGAKPNGEILPTDFSFISKDKHNSHILSQEKFEEIRANDPNYTEAKCEVIGKMLDGKGVVFLKEDIKPVECVPILNDKEKLNIFQTIWEFLVNLFTSGSERSLNREFLKEENQKSEKVFEIFEKSRRQVTFESLLDAESINNKTTSAIDHAEENALEHTHGME